MNRAGLLVAAFALLTTSANAVQKTATPSPSPAGKPTRVADCLDERFTEPIAPFHAVRFLPGKPAAFIDADDACLNLDVDKCTKRTPMDPDEPWLAGAHAGAWVCVTDGTHFGWTRAADIALGPAPATPPRDWLGSWAIANSESKFEIAFLKDGKTLHVTGTAQWQAGPDAPPHTGDLDADGVLVANELRLGEVRCLDSEYQESHEACAECVARLMFVSGRILVRDNHFCGGMNVNFNGVYDRR
jgi:hypothetical protein